MQGVYGFATRLHLAVAAEEKGCQYAAKLGYPFTRHVELAVAADLHAIVQVLEVAIVQRVQHHDLGRKLPQVLCQWLFVQREVVNLWQVRTAPGQRLPGNEQPLYLGSGDHGLHLVPHHAVPKWGLCCHALIGVRCRHCAYF